MNEAKNEISYGKLTMKEVFQKWYKIPNYQRPYVWDKEQIISLLENIKEAMKDESSEYFLGLLVFNSYEENQDGVNFTTYELVDGQQRITTLFLIMAVMNSLDDINEQVRETTGKYVYQKKDEYNGIPEKIRIVFDIRKEVKEFIKKKIIDENIRSNIDDFKNLASSKNQEKDISIKNISNAIITIIEYFEENKELNVNEFFKFLNLNVSVIYVGARGFEDAFRLFTVMNSLGVSLRNSDILKAKNLSLVQDEEKREYAQKWEEIENYFDSEFDNFLSHVRTVLTMQRAKFNLLKEYEELVYGKNKLEKGKKTIDFLEKYKTIYMEIFDKSHYERYEDFLLDNYLKVMKKGYEADYWIVPILKYYDKFKYNNLLEFVKRLDTRFSYDWITNLYVTKRIDNINDIIKAIDKAEDPQQLFKEELLNITENNKKEFKSIIENDVYGRRYARYLLLKLDLLANNNNTMSLKDTPILSIEHILPQNPKKDSEWLQLYSEEDRNNLTNKLGNLILLSTKKNSSQSNKNFREKKENYYQKNIEAFPISVQAMKNDNWNKDTLQENQNYVIDSLMNAYSEFLS